MVAPNTIHKVTCALFNQVRDKMIEITLETKRVRAAAVIQRIWRSMRLLKWIRRHPSVQDFSSTQ